MEILAVPHIRGAAESAGVIAAAGSLELPSDIVAAPLGDVEAGTVDLAIVSGAPLSEEGATVMLAQAHRALRPGGRLAVFTTNARHFYDICVASFTEQMPDTVVGAPLAAVLDVIREAGFDQVETVALRLGYGPAGDDQPTGFEMDGVVEPDAARVATLAHACVFIASRADTAREPYRSEHLADLWEGGRLEEAAAYMNAQLMENPGRARVWSDAAVILADANMTEDALRCARRAISCDPFHEAARANVVDLLAMASEESRAAGASFLELDPVIAVQNADSFMTLNMPVEAQSWAELAFMRQPGTETADALIRVLRGIGSSGRVAEVMRVTQLLVQSRSETPAN